MRRANARRKAKTASPGCRPFASAKGPEAESLPLRVFSSKNAFIRCCSLGRIPPRFRACAHSIPLALAPRISAFLFEKIHGSLQLCPFTVYAQSPSPRKKLFFFEKICGPAFSLFCAQGKNREPGLQAFPIPSFFTQIFSNFGCFLFAP